jgi:hypothetical protein
VALVKTLPADIEVLVYFDLSSTGAVDAFTLDDPLQGELDNVDYTLAGDTATDITDYTISASVVRGRRSQLDFNVPAGRATIVLDNSDRDFDPEYASSPFAGNIVPGKRIRISAAGQAIFDGLIEDWNFTYSKQRSARATVTAVDALGTLARKAFTQHTTTAGQTASQRINAALDRSEVRFGSNRDITGGRSTLQSDLVTWGSNVLNYLQLVARSDLGVLFAARNGVLTFRDRISTLNSTPVARFDDVDPDTIDIDDIEVVYGSEQLFNLVQVDRENGVVQSAFDVDSINAYGVRGLSIGQLLVDSNAQSKNIAEYLLGIYRQPEYRFDRLVSDSHLLAEAQRAAVVGIELQDVVEVAWTPSGFGTQVDKTAVVLGLEHRITEDSHRVTLHLGSVDDRTYLTLDDPIFGQLDNNVLTF